MSCLSNMAFVFLLDSVYLKYRLLVRQEDQQDQEDQVA